MYLKKERLSMNEELDYSLSKFKNALASLAEGVKNAHDDLDKDGVIQRFEFTFERFWKYLKFYLRDKGIEAKSPKDCLQAAFRLGLVNRSEERRVGKECR